MLVPSGRHVRTSSRGAALLSRRGGDGEDEQQAAAARAGGAYGATQLGAKAFGFFSVLLLARAGGPAQLGGFVADVLLAGAVTLAAEFGAATVALRSRTLSSDDETGSTFIRSRLLACWLAGSVFGIVAAAAAGTTGQRLAMIVSVGLIMAGNSIASSALIGQGDGWRSGIPNLAFNLTSICYAGVVVVFLDRPVSSILFGSYMAGALMAMLISVVVLEPLSGLSLPRRRSALVSPDRALARRAGLTGLLIYASDQTDKLMATLLGTATALGYYGLASTFQSVAVALPQIALVAVQPWFIIGLMNRARRDVFVEQVLLYLIAASSALGALLAVLAPPAIKLAAPSAFGPARHVVVVLAAGVVAQALHVLALLIVRGLGGDELSTSEPLVGYAIRLILTAAISVVSFSGFGLNGLAAGRSLADIACFALLVAALLRRSGVSVPPALVPITVTAILGVLVASTSLPTPVSGLVLLGPACISVMVLVKRSGAPNHRAEQP